MIISTVVATALIIAQGFVVLGFLKFVQSFGAYTESQRQLTAALLTVHESNLALHLSNTAMLEELRQIRVSPKHEVA